MSNEYSKPSPRKIPVNHKLSTKLSKPRYVKFSEFNTICSPMAYQINEMSLIKFSATIKSYGIAPDVIIKNSWHANTSIENSTILSVQSTNPGTTCQRQNLSQQPLSCINVQRILQTFTTENPCQPQSFYQIS